MSDQPITSSTSEIEDIHDFRLRARAWLRDTMPRPADGGTADASREEDWARARVVQRMLYDGGFAGICFPTEYGGLGLSPAHQRVFNEESRGYEMPLLLNIPTLTICAPTILDMGTEEQKRAHLPAVLRGDEVLVQFLSEPRGGSDLAGCITRAEPDGDGWRLNGTKIWSSGAYAADYALCLARTDWDVPKHRGLTMFLMKVDQPGVAVRRIRQVNGSDEFCEEFFDDVLLPADSVIGTVNDGWTVTSRQLIHERASVSGASPYTTGVRGPAARQSDLVALARETGQADDPRVRSLVARGHAAGRIRDQLVQRVGTGIRTGNMSAPAGSLVRLFHAEVDWLEADLGIEIGGAAAVVGNTSATDSARSHGNRFLQRQATSLGGGSTEMARNIISERMLGMPREYAPDRELPFGEVRQGRS